MRKCGSSVLLAVGLHNLSGLVFTVLHLHSQCNSVPNLPPSVQSNHATLASSPVTALVHISVFMETDFWGVFPPKLAIIVSHAWWSPLLLCSLFHQVSVEMSGRAGVVGRTDNRKNGWSEGNCAQSDNNLLSVQSKQWKRVFIDVLLLTLGKRSELISNWLSVKIWSIPVLFSSTWDSWIGSKSAHLNHIYLSVVIVWQQD